MNTDERLNQIRHWLKTVLDSNDFTLTAASSDASFRRYFRVEKNGQSWIVMDAPPEHEDIRPFIAIASFLERFGINVPHINAEEPDAGFLLLSDLGSTAYLSVLNESTVDKLYRDAIDEIIKMQSSRLNEISLPDYDAALLQRELDLFPEWFLGRHLEVDVPACLPTVFSLLINNATEQPQAFVHRDYHSRNLMYLENTLPGVIDFQDAVIGPISYDLVSLLRDCYIEWPQAKLDEWLAYYLDRVHEQGFITDVSIEIFNRWFDLMGLQRHLKVLGIFCRLNYRDGKAGYMNDLPLTLKYVLQITGRYPELAELHQFLVETPAIMAIL